MSISRRSDLSVPLSVKHLKTNGTSYARRTLLRTGNTVWQINVRYDSSIFIFTLKKLFKRKLTPVTYLTGPPQAFRGQCINRSYFIATMILLSNTYSTLLWKHPPAVSCTSELVKWLNLHKNALSTESLWRSRQISYSCHLTTRNLFDGTSTGFPWTMH